MMNPIPICVLFFFLIEAMICTMPETSETAPMIFNSNAKVAIECTFFRMFGVKS
jgi:hypothetical protein